MASQNPTLINIVRELMNRDNADEIILKDGAFTWNLDDLYDALLNAEELDNQKYSLQPDGIYTVKPDGYLASIPTFRFVSEEDED